MTKYLLRDRLLQSKLDNLSNGEFSKWLSEQFDITMIGDCIVFELMKEAAIELSVFVRPEAVEVIAEYNPNEWNIWPKVAPPKDVYMRVELRTKGTDLDTPEPRLGQVYFQGCGYWDGREWVVLGCHVLPDSEVRYQPWE